MCECAQRVTIHHDLVECTLLDTLREWVFGSNPTQHCFVRIL